MLPFYKKYGRTAFDILLIIGTVYLIMYLFSLFYDIAKPIFISLIIFLLIEPLAKFLNKKGLKKIIATTISTLLFVLVVVGVFVTLGVVFTNQIQQLYGSIPEYLSFFQNEILDKVEIIEGNINTLPADIIDIEELKNSLLTVASRVADILQTFLIGIFASLTSISGFIVNFILGLILAYFLSIEIKDWKKIANDKTPRTFKLVFQFLRDNVIKGIVQYIKAQVKLISFTFVIIFIALLLLGINNAFSISLLAAIFDLLPLLGVSTVFIPWIIYLLIVGKTSTAIWLTVLLAFVIVFRQIAEPKITGESLGVSAFTMLAVMVISLSLFGVAGIILSPVLLILIKSLYEQGYIKKWIHLPADEFDVEEEI